MFVPSLPSAARSLRAFILPMIWGLVADPAGAVTPADGLYEVQTVAAGAAPRFVISRGELRHASGALHTPLCQHIAAGRMLFPVTELQSFFHGYPGTRVVDRGDGHYLMTTGLVLDEHLQFIAAGNGGTAVVYAELDFITENEATLTLQAATPYFIGEGLDTTHCLARSQFAVKKVGS